MLAPADMIAFGETRLQLKPENPLVFTGPLVWSGSDGLVCGATSTDIQKYPLQHGRICNVVFCDAHVEGIAPAVLFNPTNSAT